MASFLPYASFLPHKSCLRLLLVLAEQVSTLEKDPKVVNNSEEDPKSKLRQHSTSDLCRKPKQPILTHSTEEADIHLMHQREGNPVQSAVLLFRNRRDFLRA